MSTESNTEDQNPLNDVKNMKDVEAAVSLTSSMQESIDYASSLVLDFSIGDFLKELFRSYKESC